MTWNSARRGTALLDAVAIAVAVSPSGSRADVALRCRLVEHGRLLRLHCRSSLPAEADAQPRPEVVLGRRREPWSAAFRCRLAASAMSSGTPMAFLIWRADVVLGDGVALRCGEASSRRGASVKSSRCARRRCGKDRPICTGHQHRLPVAVAAECLGAGWNGLLAAGLLVAGRDCDIADSLRVAPRLAIFDYRRPQVGLNQRRWNRTPRSTLFLIWTRIAAYSRTRRYRPGESRRMRPGEPTSSARECSEPSSRHRWRVPLDGVASAMVPRRGYPFARRRQGLQWHWGCLGTWRRHRQRPDRLSPHGRRDSYRNRISERGQARPAIERGQTLPRGHPIARMMRASFIIYLRNRSHHERT